MIVTKRAVIDSIDVDPEGSGQISFRIQRLTYIDGVRSEPTYVRQPLQAGDDIDFHLGHVNAYLHGQGFGDIEAEGVERLRREASHTWTPERVQARQERDEAERAKILAQVAEKERAEQVEKDALADEIAGLVQNMMTAKAANPSV